jgi:Polyketide cyclase / dehydrase and lipid transport
MSTFVPIPRAVTGQLGSVKDTEAIGGRDPREPGESLLEDAEDTASLEVAASAEKLWQLISDVSRMGAWSQETLRAEWVGGATGPAVGARFRSYGKGWPSRSTLIEVEAAEPGKSFGFATVAGHYRHTHWMYKLTPCDGGTRVAETRTAPTPPSYPVYAFRRIFRRDGGRSFEDGMRAALQRLKAAAEQG